MGRLDVRCQRHVQHVVGLKALEVLIGARRSSGSSACPHARSHYLFGEQKALREFDI